MDYGSKKITILSDVRLVDSADIYIDNNSESSDTRLSNYYSRFGDDELDISCESSSSTPIVPTPVQEGHNLKIIIEAVRARPAIWNIRDEKYKDKNVRIRLWEEITRESNFEVNPTNIAYCRKQWDTAKATYVWSKKNAPSGSKGVAKKPYKYARVLSFLDDTTEPRRSIELCRVLVESSVENSGRPKPLLSSSRKRTTTPIDSYLEESISIKRRYVEAVEQMRQLAPPTTAIAPSTNPTNVEVDGFLALLKPYLIGLLILLRIQAEQGILNVLSDVWKIQENDKK